MRGTLWLMPLVHPASRVAARDRRPHPAAAMALAACRGTRWSRDWRTAVDLTFEVSDEIVDGVTVVAVRGEIDVATAPTLKDRLATYGERGDAYMVVDLRAVPFLDSTGLGVLIGAARRQREHGGDLHLVATEPRVVKVFEITGLLEMLPIHADVATARREVVG